MMWIDCDFAHKRIANASRFDTMYVQYKSAGNWAVVATIGDRDILLKEKFSCEKDAQVWLEELQTNLSE